MDKYVEIEELQETSKTNAQAFQTINGHSTEICAISIEYNNNFKCTRCSKNHPKGKCKVRWPVCYNCGKGGHIAKECRTNQHNNAHKPSFRQGFRKNRTEKSHEITAEENQEFQIRAEDETNMGTFDYSTANTIFENLQVIY